MKISQKLLTKIYASIFGLLLTFGLAQTSFASYKDVSTDNPYIQGITFLELLGAIDNSEHFRPDDSISRAEFFKILFKIFNESPRDGSANPFSDVENDDWFAPFARLAAQNSLIEGKLFEPSKTIYRAEALNFLFKAYGETGGIMPWKDRITLFKDVPKFSPYYSIIKRAVDNSIITSNPEEKWRPFEEITRAELADMMLSFENWNNARKVAEQEAEKQNFYKSDIFADIWYKITNNFYIPEGQAIDEQALFESAVKGMLVSLNDPYSTYFTKTESTEFTDTLSGSFEGIGAVLSQDETTNQFFITNFIKNSPAEESGLKVGDEITAVDDVKVEGMSMDEVINRIKGPKDTEVRITIVRDGESLTYKITRKVIGIELISGKIIEKDVWYIDIDVFAGNTGDVLYRTIQDLKLEEEAPSAIVIDLRGNGGGYLNAGNAVAGMFVPRMTPLVHLDYGGGYVETIYNGDTGEYHDVPLYLFVDGYTASASEILAQTVKERDDAVIIGTQTFGKGTAQNLTEYWDGSALKLTIAHWLSADGTDIQGIGITPDVLITPNGTESTEDLDSLYLEALEKALD